jgi:branched-chain amino acid transport system permease protein
MAATYGFSVLLVEHDIPLVRRACDTVSILDRGRLIATGPPAQVFADAAVMTAYLGVIPEEPMP